MTKLRNPASGRGVFASIFFKLPGHLREVERRENVVSGTIEYRYGNDTWTQTFSARVFEERLRI